MIKMFGVDLSRHNGDINFKELSKNVDFVMLRGGYSYSVDANFIRNAKGCEEAGIPYGVYWFSYAFTPEEAALEANKCITTIKTNKLSPSLPIAFDYEEDSFNHASRYNKDVSPDFISKIAASFLDTVIKNGYKVLLYTNLNFYNKFFYSIVSKYPIWLAHWGVENPSKQCEMWQYSSTGKIGGVNGDVDLDIYYKQETENEETIKDEIWDKYLAIAKDIINGKYGNGDTRKKKLKELNYDYEIAQDIVNYLLRK